MASSTLAVYDLVALDSAGRISRVDHHFGFAYDLLVIVVAVICDYEHTVILSEVVQRSAFHLQVVLASATDEREVRVVIADRRTLHLQQFNDRKRRGFTQVV